MSPFEIEASTDPQTHTQNTRTHTPNDASVSAERIALSTCCCEDEIRLARLGYRQEVKRIFSTFTNFGLAMSMISVVLGIIPLYAYSLQTGGPVVMTWGWLVVGVITLAIVTSLGEICSAYPTMGALYYWAFKLGGEKWGPFASWMAGWTNLLGQIAGVASGGYAGAQVLSDIIYLSTGSAATRTPTGMLSLFAVMLAVAGFINTFTEVLLPILCYFSVVWHVVGVLLVVIWTCVATPHPASATFVLTEWNNDTGFASIPYVTIVGLLAAGSTFTGYDTAAHVAEETSNSHHATPRSMLYPVIMALVLGEFLIIGFNTAITDLPGLLKSSVDLEPYTMLWLNVAGRTVAILFNVFVVVAIECSNCANLTSASRMIFSFARDRALPFHRFWYKLHAALGAPVRAIWLCVAISFALGLPGLANDTVLQALFSLTATGLYASYIIPIFLRITIAKRWFKQAEFNLGRWSVPVGWIAVVWILFITTVLCLPPQYPVTAKNMNYSPIVLGAVLVFALAWWFAGARSWFKGPQALVTLVEDSTDAETSDGVVVMEVPTELGEEVGTLSQGIEAKRLWEQDEKRRMVCE